MAHLTRTSLSLIMDGTNYTSSGLANGDAIKVDESTEAIKTLIGATGDTAVLGDVQSGERTITLRVLRNSDAYNFIVDKQIAQVNSFSNIKTADPVNLTVSLEYGDINNQSIVSYFMPYAYLKNNPEDTVLNANADEAQAIVEFKFVGKATQTRQ